MAEENLQARIRGNILMALSNKFGWQLVLTTGNKSEMATGYATLYGDMAGGFAVIKDVPKTLVYELCALPQRASPAASSSRRPCIDKPPSRRAAARPARHRLAAAVRRPRPDPRRPTSRRTAASKRSSPWASTRRLVQRVVQHGRPQRVQAPPGAARAQGHAARLRPRPPPADHEPVPAELIGMRGSDSGDRAARDNGVRGRRLPDRYTRPRRIAATSIRSRR